MDSTHQKTYQDRQRHPQGPTITRISPHRDRITCPAFTTGDTTNFSSLPPWQRQWETATHYWGRWLDGYCRTPGRWIKAVQDTFLNQNRSQHLLTYDLRRDTSSSGGVTSSGGPFFTLFRTLSGVCRTLSGVHGPSSGPPLTKCT